MLDARGGKAAGAVALAAATAGTSHASDARAALLKTYNKAAGAAAASHSPAAASHASAASAFTAAAAAVHRLRADRGTAAAASADGGDGLEQNPMLFERAASNAAADALAASTSPAPSASGAPRASAGLFDSYNLTPSAGAVAVVRPRRGSPASLLGRRAAAAAVSDEEGMETNPMVGAPGRRPVRADAGRVGPGAATDAAPTEAAPSGAARRDDGTLLAAYARPGLTAAARAPPHTPGLRSPRAPFADGGAAGHRRRASHAGSDGAASAGNHAQDESVASEAGEGQF